MDLSSFILMQPWFIVSEIEHSTEERIAVTLEFFLDSSCTKLEIMKTFCNWKNCSIPLKLEGSIHESFACSVSFNNK